MTRILGIANLVAAAMVILLTVGVVAQDALETVDPTPDSLTFAVLLTAAGAGIAAGIITALVQLIKSVSPAIDARISGAAMAFIASAVLFLLAGIAVGVDQLDEGLVVFVAWLTCATAAVGIYATAKHAADSNGG